PWRGSCAAVAGKGAQLTRHRTQRVRNAARYRTQPCRRVPGPSYKAGVATATSDDNRSAYEQTAERSWPKYRVNPKARSVSGPCLGEARNDHLVVEHSLNRLH